MIFSLSFQVDGASGASRVWRKMLLQMHNVSADIADAIVLQYPTIRNLTRAYDMSCSIEHSELLLQDLRRGSGRRVGPELSKKIFKLLTCKLRDDIIVH